MGQKLSHTKMTKLDANTREKALGIIRANPTLSAMAIKELLKTMDIHISVSFVYKLRKELKEPQLSENDNKWDISITSMSGRDKLKPAADTFKSKKLDEKQLERLRKELSKEVTHSVGKLASMFRVSRQTIYYYRDKKFHLEKRPYYEENQFYYYARERPKAAMKPTYTIKMSL